MFGVFVVVGQTLRLGDGKDGVSKRGRMVVVDVIMVVAVVGGVDVYRCSRGCCCCCYEIQIYSRRKKKKLGQRRHGDPGHDASTMSTLNHTINQSINQNLLHLNNTTHISTEDISIKQQAKTR